MIGKKGIALLALVLVIETGAFVYGTYENNNYDDKYKNLQRPYFPEMGGESGVKKLDYKNLSTQKESHKIFHAKAVDNPHQKAKDLATNLGMEGELEVKDTGAAVLIFGKEGKSIELFKNSGGFIYHAKKDRKINTENVPTDQEAKKIAEDFIKSLGYNEYTFSKVNSSKVMSGDINDKEEKVFQKSVYFERKLNGKKVMGFDRIEVDISSNGEIDSLYVFTRDYTEGSTVVSLSPY